MGKYEDAEEQAHIRLMEAQRDLAEKQAEVVIEELAAQRIDLQRKELFLAREVRREIELSNAAEHHRVYTFSGSVDGLSVERAIRTLSNWTRQDPTCDITFEVNSPGGNVFEGLALYDFMRGLSERGHHITTVAIGMAASMGGILLQAGDTRVMTPNAFMLIHEVSSLGIGSITDLKDEVKFLEELQNRCVKILTEKSKLTPKKIRDNWERKDWWLSSEECKTLKLVDRVGWA